MNKNLLIIGAAIGAYALLRPKTGSLVASTTKPGGAAAYTPPSYVPSYAQPSAPAPAPAGNWLNTAAGAATTAAGIVKAGTSIWSDIASAFHIGDDKSKAAAVAPAAAPATAGGSVWAGPSRNYQDS